MYMGRNNNYKRLDIQLDADLAEILDRMAHSNKMSRNQTINNVFKEWLRYRRLEQLREENKANDVQELKKELQKHEDLLQDIKSTVFAVYKNTHDLK